MFVTSDLPMNFKSYSVFLEDSYTKQTSGFCVVCFGLDKVIGTSREVQQTQGCYDMYSFQYVQGSDNSSGKLQGSWWPLHKETELDQLQENLELPRDCVGKGRHYWLNWSHFSYQWDQSNRTLTCPTHDVFPSPFPLSVRSPWAICLPCPLLKVFLSAAFLFQIYLLTFFTQIALVSGHMDMGIWSQE